MKRAIWARIEARDAQLAEQWHADVVKGMERFRE